MLFLSFSLHSSSPTFKLFHGFLWWWACYWLIFSLKWHLQSSFPLLQSIAIDLQEVKDFTDEEDPRPTSSTWSYITCSHYNTSKHPQNIMNRHETNWPLLTPQKCDTLSQKCKSFAAKIDVQGCTRKKPKNMGWVIFIM